MSCLEDIDVFYIPRNEFYDIERPLYDLFMCGRYEEAFDKLYVRHCRKNYQASYLIGLYYEFGLKPVLKDLKEAGNVYTSVIAYCDNPYLESKARNGLKRVIISKSNKILLS